MFSFAQESEEDSNDILFWIEKNQNDFETPTIQINMIQLHLFKFFLLMFESTLSFNPAIEMPFTEILGSSSQINTIGNSLKCEDGRNETKSCAVDCLRQNGQGAKCAGFLQRNTTNCYLCEVIDASEIDSGEGTTIMSDDKLYILQSARVDPDIYISMDDYDLSTQTIQGKGVTGKSSGINASDLISDGKVGQAIYLHDGNRIVLIQQNPNASVTLTCAMGHCQYCFGSSHLEPLIKYKL